MIEKLAAGVLGRDDGPQSGLTVNSVETHRRSQQPPKRKRVEAVRPIYGLMAITLHARIFATIYWYITNTRNTSSRGKEMKFANLLFDAFWWDWEGFCSKAVEGSWFTSGYGCCLFVCCYELRKLPWDDCVAISSDCCDTGSSSNNLNTWPLVAYSNVSYLEASNDVI